MKKLINTTTLYLAIGIVIFASVFAIAAPFNTEVVNHAPTLSAISGLPTR